MQTYKVSRATAAGAPRASHPFSPTHTHTPTRRPIGAEKKNVRRPQKKSLTTPPRTRSQLVLQSGAGGTAENSKGQVMPADQVPLAVKCKVRTIRITSRRRRVRQLGLRLRHGGRLGPSLPVSRGGRRRELRPQQSWGRSATPCF